MDDTNANQEENLTMPEGQQQNAQDTTQFDEPNHSNELHQDNTGGVGESGDLPTTDDVAGDVSVDVDAQEEFRTLQALWDNEQEPESLNQTLRRMSEIVEQEVCEYYKLDPDPFDDRQPDEQNLEFSSSPFGRIMSEIDELFLEKLIDLYILPASGDGGTQNEDRETLTLACRLLYNILPASISFSFENDSMREAGSLLEKLISLAKETCYDGDESNLKYYVLALLAQGSSVECPFSNSSNHAAFEELASSALQQLHKLKEQTRREMCPGTFERPFAHLSQSPQAQSSLSQSAHVDSTVVPSTPVLSRVGNVPSSAHRHSNLHSSTPTPLKGSKRPLSTPGNSQEGSSRKRIRRLSPTNFDAQIPKATNPVVNELQIVKRGDFHENSNSWADVGPMYIGTYSLEPLTITMKQRILLQFLTPLAEYQELLSIFLEEQSLELIDFYLEVALHKDIRLTFEALRFLSGLLCHRRVAAKFVLNSDGLNRLASVCRPSVAATAVSMCLFYIACCRDVFERALPQLNPHVLRDVCRYGLWLLECCSHESGRCHATMFFAEIFPFRCLLEAFDAMDGLRTLHNSITTLEIFNNIIANAVNESASHALESRRPGSSNRQQTVNSRASGLPFNHHTTMNSDFLMGVGASDDRSDSIRQAIKHYCVALKSYFSMHLAMKTDYLKKSLKRTPLYLPQQSHKAADINRRIELKNMWFLLENAPLKTSWTVVEQFMKLQGLQVLLQICYMAQEWKSYQFRADTLRNALDVIACITAHPKYQETLCQTIEVPVSNTDQDEMQNETNYEQITGTKIILNLAEGATVQDAEVQKSAMRVIINCVCGPYGIQYTGLPGDQVLVGLGHPKLTGYPPNPQDKIIEKMWASVRSNNGLQVLLSLAVTKTPAADAELLRSLACVALYGLCLDDSIKQIVSRMPLFSQGLLEIAMREPPVQPDKMLDHQKFTHCGAAIIDRVFSTRKYYHPCPSGAWSIEELRRAEIVAQTRISWDPKELLALISEHLDFLGYTNSAKTLFQEAELASFYKTHKLKPVTLLPKPRNAPRLSVTVGQPGQPMEIVRLPSNQTSLPLRAVSHTSSLTQPQRIMFTNVASAQPAVVPSSPISSRQGNPQLSGALTVANRAVNTANPVHTAPTPPGSPMSWPCRAKNRNATGSAGDNPSVPSTPETYVSVKKQIQQSRGLAPVVPSPVLNTSSMCSPNVHSLSQEVDLNTSSTAISLSNPSNVNQEENKSLSLPWRASVPKKSRTLNNIVESYLESQHAKCERPIVFCPPFSLKEQHKCPEPLHNTSAPLSAAKRLAMRKLYAPSSGTEGNSFNRKLIHSRFRPVMTFSESNIDRGFFTSVCFSKCRSDLYIGTSMGEVRRYSCATDGQMPVCSFECHDTAISGIDLTSNSGLMLTTVSWGTPGATLWKLSEDRTSCSRVMDFANEMHCEFSKVSQDLVIGSVNEKAFVYDINSKTRIRSLYHPSYANDYLMNMATGSYHSNNMVLNDGVLWDTRQASPIHKYDKFNASIAGQFHPNTLQVVINSEVWDMRTHKLLQTVPALDQCLIWFNNAHDVIYSSAFTAVDDDRSLTMASCIKTIDAVDYQTIATLDIKKKVGDVSIEPRDLYMAVIENGGGNGGVFLHESGICKIYEVGVPREPDQEDEDNSDNDEDEDDDDDDDDDEDEDEDEDDDAVIFDEILNHQMPMPPHRSNASASTRGGGSGLNAPNSGGNYGDEDDDESSGSSLDFDDTDSSDEEFEDGGMLVDEDSLGSMGNRDGDDEEGEENSPDSLLDDMPIV